MKEQEFFVCRTVILELKILLKLPLKTNANPTQLTLNP